MDEEGLFDEFGNYIGPDSGGAGHLEPVALPVMDDEDVVVAETGDRFAMVTVEEGMRVKCSSIP